MSAKARARRWVKKIDPEDPIPRREHARRLVEHAREPVRARLTKDQTQLVHAAREQLAADAKAKAHRQRRKAAATARRANRR